MKLSAQIALIVSALALPLSAYAEEGENSTTQDIAIQPQTEIATRSVPQHAGGGGGRFGVTNATSAGGGGTFSGGGGGGSSALAKAHASQAKNESSFSVANEILSNAWQDRADHNKKERDKERERERQENNKSEKNFLERLWDRLRN